MSFDGGHMRAFLLFLSGSAAAHLDLATSATILSMVVNIILSRLAVINKDTTAIVRLLSRLRHVRADNGR